MVPRRLRQFVAMAAALLLAGLLAGCQDISDFAGARALSPVSASLKKAIDAKGMAVRSAIMLRIYKEDSVLEVWKEDRAGRMQLLKDYKICAWSGNLGPKIKEGDRQVPEGFYTVTPGQMNPNSSYYLSFNIGFPNAFDRSLNRTGSDIMVHGDCSSRGCYSMTDEQVEEIYVLAREAFAGGQRAFQVQAFPFRMTAENMAKHADDANYPFWQMLKEGADHFEVSQKVPQVAVCGKRYVFDATPAGGTFRPAEKCPDYTVAADIQSLVAEKRAKDDATTATMVADIRAKAERDARWAEREKALAAMFRAGQGPGADDASADGATAVAAADGTAPTTALKGVVPATRSSQPAGAAALAAAGPAGAPAAGKAAVAATSAAQPRPTAVAAAGDPGKAATVAASPAKQLKPTAVAAAPRDDVGKPAAVAAAPAAAAGTAVASTAVPAPPLGYAENPLPDDGDAGFFDAVTKRSQGLFRRAGSLFN